MKKIISYILSVFIVLQAASGFALAENSAGAEYHIPESDYLYVDGVAASIVSEENLSVPPFNTLPILEDNK